MLQQLGSLKGLPGMFASYQLPTPVAIWGIGLLRALGSLAVSFLGQTDNRVSNETSTK
jgi:hypothetical protein